MIKLGVSLKRHLATAQQRVERGGILCAQLEGFDLHGRVAFGAAQRDRIEELVRYCARPPLANDRLGRGLAGGLANHFWCRASANRFFLCKLKLHLDRRRYRFREAALLLSGSRPF